MNKQMVVPYLLLFLLGFLTDKLRILPFFLGCMFGVLLKSFLSTTPLAAIPEAGWNLYQKYASGSGYSRYSGDSGDSGDS